MMRALEWARLEHREEDKAAEQEEEGEETRRRRKKQERKRSWLPEREREKREREKERARRSARSDVARAVAPTGGRQGSER